MQIFSHFYDKLLVLFSHFLDELLAILSHYYDELVTVLSHFCDEIPQHSFCHFSQKSLPLRRKTFFH